MKVLAETATESEATVSIMDSSGFALGPLAAEFQVHMIDLIHPDYLVALERQQELESIMAVFSRRKGMRQFRLKPSPGASGRTVAQRSAHRAQRFRRYFSAAIFQELPCDLPGMHWKTRSAKSRVVETKVDIPG